MVRTALLIQALAALAADPALAEGRKLSGPEIKASLTGRTFLGADPAHPNRQTFLANGETTYSTGGDISTGRWDVRGDHYCSQWPPQPSWTCFEVMTEGTGLSFRSAHGDVYPVRPE